MRTRAHGVLERRGGRSVAGGQTEHQHKSVSERAHTHTNEATALSGGHGGARPLLQCLWAPNVMALGLNS